MNPIFKFYNNLSEPLKIILGIFIVFGTLFSCIIVYAAVRSGSKEPEWDVPNKVDRSVIPAAYAEQVQVKKPEEIVLVQVQKEPERTREVPKETFVVKKKTEETKKEPIVKKYVVDKIKEEQHKEELPKQPPTQLVEVEVRDLEAEAIAAFNAKALQFSSEDHGRLRAKRFSTSALSQRFYKRTIDKNKEKKWKIKTDENTYPTDLSRVVTKEKFIKCITKNKIVSTLAGKVTIIVSENVYGAQGNLILIPIGAEGTGIYNPVEKIGNDRINLYVERFVNKEDGQLILFSNPAIAGDQQGATGVTGEIDRKYLEKIGMPLIFSFANNLANLGFAKVIEGMEGGMGDEEESISKELFDAEWERNQANTNSQVVNEYLRQNFNIKETITIPAATEITVYLNHDVWFKPNLNGNIVQAVKLEPTWRSENKPIKEESPKKPSGP